MAEDLEFYLNEINFEKQLEKLKRKLKNKTIVIYGTGMLFEVIVQHYDLSGLNIIGVSDRKYTIEDEGKTAFGYKIIPMHKISEYEPNYVLVAILNYLLIIENFEKTMFKREKTKVRPFAQKKFSTILKEIWGM